MNTLIMRMLPVILLLGLILTISTQSSEGSTSPEMIPANQEGEINATEAISENRVRIVWEGNRLVALIIGDQEFPMQAGAERIVTLPVDHVLSVSVKTPQQSFKAEEFLLIDDRPDTEITFRLEGEKVVFEYGQSEGSHSLSQRPTPVGQSQGHEPQREESQTAHDNRDEEPEVFVVAEQMPEIIGGQRALYRNLVYPEAARRAGIEGRVIIQFIVDENGDVTDPKIARDIGAGTGEAAINAIRSVRFTPGVQRGRNVKVQMTLPVVFRLSD